MAQAAKCEFPKPPAPTSAAAVDDKLFKQAMRRLASGVSLVTTAEGNLKFGLAATSVVSVTAAPPTLLVCINKSASCHDPLKRSGIFCVSFLAQKDQEIAQLFAKSGSREDRFNSSRWIAMKTGAPALEGCLASMDCERTRLFDADSHTIFLGEIREIRLWGSDISPLIYLDGAYKA